MKKAGRKILVVDDQPEMVGYLKEILDSQYRVFAARSGKSALEIAQKEKPDLILLDIIMPEMDGYEVCDELKKMQETSNIPVIFLTALNGSDEEEKGLTCGAVDYISKPISPGIVNLRVRNHLQLKYQIELLERISMTDALTGLANRRALDLLLEREIHTAVRRNEAITLMMIDVDHFKNYNDFYGHPAGDECLKKIASTLSDCVQRTVDVVARYGGEEFALVLPDTDAEGAQFIGDLILQEIEALQIPHAASEVSPHVSVSIGSATAIANATLTPLRLIKIADDMLYASKDQGRKRANYHF